MSNCMICFCDFEDGKKYKCCDPRCMEHVCLDCLKRYMDISEQENNLPKCPREKCEGVFDEQTIDSSLVTQYRQLLMQHFRTVKTSEIESHGKARAVISLLKEEKMKFAVDSMPKAVQRVANVLFVTRLRKVRKVQADRDINRISRTCINLVCNGFLDETFSCTKCKTSFCKECEEEKEDGHECNKEILESVKFVNNMVCCPNCKTKIEKGEGCMAITCAVCKTNFWYNTGEAGEAGNHGKYVDVNLRESVSLVKEYREYILPEHAPHISELEHIVRDSEFDKLQVSFEKMILENTQFLAKFSETYSKIIRKKVEVEMASNKLKTLEKILRKHEPGYEKQISDILEIKKISVGHILSTSGNVVFVDNVSVFDTLAECISKMCVSRTEIRKAVEKGDGIIKGFVYEYM